MMTGEPMMQENEKVLVYFNFKNLLIAAGVLIAVFVIGYGKTRTRIARAGRRSPPLYVA
jgi:hypothetical protein